MDDEDIAHLSLGELEALHRSATLNGDESYAVHLPMMIELKRLGLSK